MKPQKVRFSPPEEENLKVMFMLRVVSGAHGHVKCQTEDTGKSLRSVCNLPREWHPVYEAVCVCG
jgi:hypothetical protein